MGCSLLAIQQSRSFETRHTSLRSFHHPTVHPHFLPPYLSDRHPTVTEHHQQSYPSSWSHCAIHPPYLHSRSCLHRVRLQPPCASSKTCSKGPSRRRKSGFHQLWPKYAPLLKCAIKPPSLVNSSSRSSNHRDTRYRSSWRTLPTRVYHLKRHKAVLRPGRPGW